ncbi:WD40 repeat-like protein [Suillus weaverae]|nr:WD40 repeat-like protein [Suillus weaverae]
MDHGTARIWDVESGETVLGPIKTGHKWVYVVAYSPDSTKIATGGLLENGIKIWDATSAELLHAVIHNQSVGSLTWTSDSNKLVSASSDNSIRIFDTATWQELAILEHQDVVYITLSSNNRFLVSGSNDGTALMWNLDTNLPIDPPIQHECEVDCVSISADGKLLVTCCGDTNVYTWYVPTILNETGLEDLLSTSNVSVNISATLPV